MAKTKEFDFEVNVDGAQMEDFIISVKATTRAEAFKKAGMKFLKENVEFIELVDESK